MTTMVGNPVSGVASSSTKPFFKDKTPADLNKLLMQSKALKARFEPIWYLNQMFYIGDQWVFWNRGRLDRPRLDPWRVTLTDNRIAPVVEKNVARKTKQKPSFQVVPTTDEDQDMESSAIGEKVLEYLWRHLALERRLYDVLLWSEICGAGFWKVTWDNGRGKKTQIVQDEQGNPIMYPDTQDEEGNTIPGGPMKPHEAMDEQGRLPEGMTPKTIATGDVHVEVVSPFEIYQDPIAKELEDCEWIIQTTVHSPEYVKQRYGISVDPDTDVAPGPAEARLFPSWQMGGTTGYRGVLLKEYWCKPNDQHPQGRRAVWAGGGKDAAGKMLFEEDVNPYKELPYVMFKGWPMPGRFWPTSVCEQLKSPQTELNKLKSQVMENIQRIGNPALLASRQANINYSGSPGERIDYDDTTQNALPSYLQAPPMPQYVEQMIDRYEKTIEEISGQHEVTNAQVPAGVKAASAINLLQEADDTRLGPKIYEMESNLAKAGEMLLKLVSEYWSQERTVQVAGADNQWDIMSFRGAALRENTHVEVQAGSAFPRSKAMKQAAIENILQLTFQYEGQQPINRLELAKLLEDYDQGALSKLFGDLQPSEIQIKRENGEISQGAELPINPYDDHPAHIERHTEYQRGGTYKYLPPLVKQMFERHVALHRVQMMQQQQRAQQQEQLQQEQLQMRQAATQQEQGQEQHDQEMQKQGTEHAQEMEKQESEQKHQLQVAKVQAANRPKPSTQK